MRLPVNGGEVEGRKMALSGMPVPRYPISRSLRIGREQMRTRSSEAGKGVTSISKIQEL